MLAPLGLELQAVVDSRGCWELNPGLLQEQHVLLTAEPTIYSLSSCTSDMVSH